MSVSVVTRRCVEGGVPAIQWIHLVQTALNAHNQQPDTTAALDIVQNILSLLLDWPSNQDLINYLGIAVTTQTVPLHLIVSCFLLAFHTGSLRDLETLDLLCTLSVQSHRESPINSVVDYQNSIEPVSATIQRALHLVQTAHVLNSSSLSGSSTDLFLSMLPVAMPVFSQASQTEKAEHLNSVLETLHLGNLRADLRASLDQWRMDVGQLLAAGGSLPGADAELLELHAASLADAPELLSASTNGAEDGTIASSDLHEVVMCSLILRNSVDYRGQPWGCGNTERTLGNLLAAYRWSGGLLPAFCTQVILAAILQLSEHVAIQSVDHVGVNIWKAFVFGRLPTLLQKLIEQVPNASPPAVLAVAIGSLLTRLESLQGLSAGRWDALAIYPPAFGTERSGIALQLDLLSTFVKTNLLAMDSAAELFPRWSPNYMQSSNLEVDVQNFGQSVEEYVREKLEDSLSDEEKQTWSSDYSFHGQMVKAAIGRYTQMADALDLEGMALMCDNWPLSIDVIALHGSIEDIVMKGLRFIETFDWENIDDPQSNIMTFGNIVLFLQQLCGRYRITSVTLSSQFSPDHLLQSNYLDTPSQLDEKDHRLFKSWMDTLFVKDGGVGDEIIKATPPKVLLRISPMLISEAIISCQTNESRATAMDTLQNGLSYFQNPVLAWTLLGVVKYLANQIEQHRYSVLHLEVLRSLICWSGLSPGIIKMTGRTLMRVLRYTENAPNLAIEEHRKPLKDTVAHIMQPRSFQVSTSGNYSPSMVPTHLLQAALSSSRSQLATSLDVPHILALQSPIRFLSQMWNDLLLTSASQLGDSDVARIFATYVLTDFARTGPTQVPLLPVFLYVTLPEILSGFDDARRRGVSDVGTIVTSTEILAGVLGSALRAALQMDRTIGPLSGIANADTPTAMAEKLHRGLKSVVGPEDSESSAAILLKRLQTTQNFVSHFPVFLT